MIPPWVAVLREFGEDPEALFFPLKTKSLGTIPIWAGDIRAAASDEALMDMVAMQLRRASVDLQKSTEANAPCQKHQGHLAPPAAGK
jgi:hypothetical protein